MNEEDKDKLVNAKLNALQTFAIRKEIEKWKTEWAYRSAFVAFTVLLVLGAIFIGYGFLSPTITFAGFATFNGVGLLLWFMSLFIAVGAFGTPKGKGG